MLLRPRQKIFVEKSVAALKEHGNTLGVAMTGAGKTLMFSAVTAEILKDTRGKACVLAHRDELTSQNTDKFRKINPGLTTSIFDATTKSCDGDATFAMVQTLSRENNLSLIPKLDLLIIDEAHHAVADGYQKILSAV